MNDLTFMIPIFAIVFTFGFAAFAVFVGAKTKQKRKEYILEESEGSR